MSDKIIKEARSWLETRFKHQGRIKRGENDLGGCDCLGLIIGVAKSLNIKAINGKPLELLDQNNYSRLLSSNILYDNLNQLLFRVEIDEIQPGDIILLQINEWPQHLAIISAIAPNIKIIHSYNQVHKVVEQHLSADWFNKIIAVYRFIV